MPNYATSVEYSMNDLILSFISACTLQVPEGALNAVDFRKQQTQHIFFVNLSFVLLRIRCRTAVKDPSFLHERPCLVGIIRFHVLGGLHGVRAEVLLVNLTLLIDDKSHHSRLAPV
jgi:hypothetical protein